MEVFYPFMLFILAIPGDDPDALDLARHPVLYETMDDCLAAGAAIIDARILVENEDGTSFRAFCEQVPEGHEFDTLFLAMNPDRAHGAEQ